jgi:hypothetical protein
MCELLPAARLPNPDCLFDESRIGHKSISAETKKPTPPRKPGKSWLEFALAPCQLKITSDQPHF